MYVIIIRGENMEISELLIRLGFRSNNLGFRYLVDLISRGLKGDEIEPLSRKGYTLLSEMTGKSVGCIEKDIQNCINSAWLYGNSDMLYKIFGDTISDVKGKPTNKQFIYTIIEKIKYSS